MDSVWMPSESFWHAKIQLDMDRISAWLADEKLRSQYSKGILDQTALAKLFDICAQGAPDADQRLMELIVEYEHTTQPHNR